MKTPTLQLVSGQAQKTFESSATDIRKVYDTPLAIIEHNTLLIKNMQDSIKPEDVTQRIELAKNIIEKAQMLLKEQTVKRDDLIRALGGKVD
jgi:hypothetical protein